MKGKVWFAIGLALLAGILGFLVGASHSPVAGVAITAAFGLAVPLFSLLRGKSGAPTAPNGQSHRSLSPRELEITGKILSAFCVVFVAGMLLGGYSRLRDWPAPHHRVEIFPWTDQAPNTAYHAIDWIIVQHRLRGMGYTDQQVQQLYSIQRKEWGASEPGSNAPLSSLFSQSDVVKKDPGGVVVYQEPTLLPELAKPPSPN